MQFRWVGVIALWTVLSAPVFGPPPTPIAPDDRPRTARGTSGSVHSLPEAQRPAGRGPERPVWVDSPAMEPGQ